MGVPPDQAERLRAALAPRYRLLNEVGRGGMATVFLAQDRRHSRPVAVKVLHPELSVGLGPDRFLREIQIAARLQHPHIVPLYDSGQAGDLLYYVMPYVEGESLRQRLERERRLPIEDALDIARAVAAALDYAHRQQVVHRDIKPENVMLHEGEAVVTDFGIAKAVTAAAGANLTQTGTAVGTPAYMSPEQAAGEAELDGRSDIYSLGAMLYEMLGGTAPFTGATIQAVIAQLFESLTAFDDDRHLIQIIQRIVGRIGRRIDETTPMVDARLPDGSRVNAIIPPAALDGPLVSIRRFGSRPLLATDLLADARRRLDALASVQLADVDADLLAMGRYDRVPFGTGAVPNDDFVRALVAGGYTGPVEHETLVPGYDRTSVLDAGRRWIESAVGATRPAWAATRATTTWTSSCNGEG